MLNILISASLIAVSSVVWIQMLVKPNEALDFLPMWVMKLFQSPDPSKPFRYEWQQKLMKVLFQCEKCFSGQLALWGYFFIYPSWNPFKHIILILLSIFMARVAGGLISKYL